MKREGRVQQSVERVDRSRYYEITSAANSYFSARLREADTRVKKYLLERALDKEIINRFGVGFAPDTWHGLTQFLLEKKFEPKLIVGAGLARRNAKGDLYDAFRGRLMFPVWISRDRIAGFGGRVIPSLYREAELGEIPKYVNSIETPIYQKRKILFGLPQAIDAIRSSKEVYIVEGYLDVIGLSSVGVQNAVATCGTALTEDHVKRVATMAKRVSILFDADPAGRAAAGKSFQTFLNSGVDVAAIFLPEGEDPDSVARAHHQETGEYLRSLEPAPLIDCFVDYLVQQTGRGSIADLGAATKGSVSTTIVEALARVDNSIERNELVKRAAFRLRVPGEELSELIRVRMGGEKIQRTDASQETSSEGSLSAVRLGRKSIAELPVLDRTLLHAVMARKESLAEAVLQDSNLCVGIDEDTRAFVEELNDIMSESGASEEQKKERIISLLKEFGDSWAAHWKASYRMLEDPTTDFDKTLSDCRSALYRSRLGNMIRELDSEIGECEDHESQIALIKRKFSLSRLLQESENYKEL